MNSDLGKAVRREFELAIAGRLSGFVEVRNAPVPHGCRLYEQRTEPSGAFYMLLIISPTMDRFTVECAWSPTGSFPSHLPISSPVDIPSKRIRRDEPTGAEYRFRLGDLWSEGNDYWWYVLRDKRKTVDEGHTISSLTSSIRMGSGIGMIDTVHNCVNDAMNRLVEHGVPFLERIRALSAHDLMGR